MEEAFRNSEAPEVLEAVQQPVGVGGIVARLELPEPDEPRHAGVDRLFEQILEVAPKPGRNPLGDAGFDPAFRVDQRVGADPLDRRRGPESVQAAQFGKMLVPCLGPHRVVGEFVPIQVELASDEIHDGRRNELTRSKQAARVAEHAQLQREAQLVAGTPPGPPMFCRSSSLRV